MTLSDLGPVKDLVKDWTSKAQNHAYTDDERAMLYKCAEELHTALIFIEVTND